MSPRLTRKGFPSVPASERRRPGLVLQKDSPFRELRPLLPVRVLGPLLQVPVTSLREGAPLLLLLPATTLQVVVPSLRESSLLPMRTGMLQATVPLLVPDPRLPWRGH